MSDANGHQEPGGSGGGLPTIGGGEPTTRDTRMEERAIRQRWNIRPELREKVLARMEKVLDDQAASHREATAACRAVIHAEQQNQSDQHKDKPDRIEISMVDDDRLGDYTERLGLQRPRLRAALQDTGNGHKHNGH